MPLKTMTLETLPSYVTSKEVMTLMNWLNTHGEARFVGGCVRDALLGKENADVDIATTILPEQMMELGKADGLRVEPTGIKYGTVTFIIDRVPFEVTTLRADVDNDGRHPVVEYTDDWEVDALRRDMTINALSMDVDGKIYDYATGLKDIEARHVRFVGEANGRIEEDYLRILRFFRFSAYYSDDLDQEGLKACEALSEGITTLSGERVQQEWLKLLLAPNPTNVLVAMVGADILPKIFNGAKGDAISGFKVIIDKEQSLNTEPDVIIRMAWCLRLMQVHADIDVIAKHLKLSNKHKQRLSNLSDIAWLDDVSNDHDIKIAIDQRGNDLVKDSLLLYAAMKGEQNVTSWFDLGANWLAPAFPVNGDDMKSLGLIQGEAIGQGLSSLRQYWYDSDFKADKASLLAYAKEHIVL